MALQLNLRSFYFISLITFRTTWNIIVPSALVIAGNGSRSYPGIPIIAFEGSYGFKGISPVGQWRLVVGYFTITQRQRDTGYNENILCNLHSNITGISLLSNCSRQMNGLQKRRNWRSKDEKLTGYNIKIWYLFELCLYFVLKFFKNNIKKIWLREIAGRKCKCSWQLFPNIWKYANKKIYEF